jgi:3-deoxy-7-phosphoheptulonate synthase
VTPCDPRVTSATESHDFVTLVRTLNFPRVDGEGPPRFAGMVVVMSPDATAEDVATVVARVEAAGGEAFVSRGLQRTIIGLVGDIGSFHQLNLRTLRGVADVRRISDPYKLVSRQHHPDRSTVWVGRTSRVPIGPDTFTLMAGPCAVESRDQTLAAAQMARSAGATLLRGGAYMPRTSPYAFQGLGVAGLEILADVGVATGLPVVTEVVDARDVPVVAEHADMLQIGSRNMANVGLLQAAGGTGRPVLLERGMNATLEEWLMAAEYIAQRGNLDIVLCERGIRTFETSYRNTLDIAAVPAVQAASHLPVIVDPSHAAGRKDLVVPLARAAIAVGADGVLVDVHPHPELALCDGAQALDGAELRELATAVRRLPPVLGRVDARALVRSS